MTDSDLMPFGKFKGTKMANVPSSYLKHIYDEGIVTVFKWNPVFHYIKDNMDVIETDIKRIREQNGQ